MPGDHGVVEPIQPRLRSWIDGGEHHGERPVDRGEGAMRWLVTDKCSRRSVYLRPAPGVRLRRRAERIGVEEPLLRADGNRRAARAELVCGASAAKTQAIRGEIQVGGRLAYPG